MSTTRRWRVRRYSYQDGFSQFHVWKAEVSSRIPGIWTGPTFDTWREAYDHAFRMASARSVKESAPRLRLSR